MLHIHNSVKIGHSKGFTLIELSIVLVIIGLVVGGVLVGRDLIDAANIRATIGQIEKFNVAARTFQTKYNALPGDIPQHLASGFGFAARGQFAGQGDGNGLLEGVDSNFANRNRGWRGSAGETLMFWVDLSRANLIEGNFSTGTPAVPFAGQILTTTNPTIHHYFPRAKIRDSVYVYVWSGGWNSAASDWINYFGLTRVDAIDGNGPGVFGSFPYFDRGLTPMQAYSIDNKLDDGDPMAGRVLALYVNETPRWASAIINPAPYTFATPQDAYSCFDNGNVAGPQRYSTSSGSGNYNCAISIRFQ